VWSGVRTSGGADKSKLAGVMCAMGVEDPYPVAGVIWRMARHRIASGLLDVTIWKRPALNRQLPPRPIAV
jgi:hypothetical protein